METVTDSDATPKEVNKIDYNALADYYNTQVDVGQAVRMATVYNITIFKECLTRRGVASEKDFQAFNRDGHTYVKKLTRTLMTKD